MAKKSLKTTKPAQSISYFSAILCGLIFLSYVGLAYMYFMYQNIKPAQTDSLAKINANISQLETQITENKKIYVYNLEEVLRQTNALETKKQFEDEIIRLNDELLEAEKKINSLKTAKVKEDFSSIYLQNLKMKRDELVNNYENNIEELTNKINAALSEIAQEKNIPVIFVHNAIALNTNFVVDLTNEVVAKMQK